MTPDLYLPTRANSPHGTIWFETQPRHLAGRGDPRHITQALRAAGWANRSDPDFPHVLLVSPDYRHTVVLEPDPGPSGAWWRIRGQEDGRHWYTEFGAHTPVEILAHLADALIQPVPEQTPPIWSPLTAAGWSYERDEQGNEMARHPDASSAWSGGPSSRVRPSAGGPRLPCPAAGVAFAGSGTPTSTSRCRPT